MELFGFLYIDSFKAILGKIIAIILLGLNLWM